jgi:tRNA(His) 5'-end guanylyltransferase
MPSRLDLTVSFGRFSDTHGFEKPNDMRALELMNHAAKDVMEAYPDIVLAFGESDEFRYFVSFGQSSIGRRAPDRCVVKFHVAQVMHTI